MELYFAPLACSLATRIALYEAGVEARFIQVDTRTKRTADGEDFFTINPMGQVPVLRTDDGILLTENAAILQFVGESHPSAGLMPDDRIGRAELRKWLSFIASELHTGIFHPLLGVESPEGAKDHARSKIKRRFTVLDAHLQGRDFLLDRFSVADAFLFTVLNWTAVSDIELSLWPALHAYHRGLRQRAAFARAFAEERALYLEQQAKRAA